LLHPLDELGDSRLAQLSVPFEEVSRSNPTLYFFRGLAFIRRRLDLNFLATRLQLPPLGYDVHDHAARELQGEVRLFRGRNKFAFNLSTRSFDRLLSALLTHSFQFAGEPSAEIAESLLSAKELWLKVDLAAD
jgi:hypothetical protein